MFYKGHCNFWPRHYPLFSLSDIILVFIWGARHTLHIKGANLKSRLFKQIRRRRRHSDPVSLGRPRALLQVRLRRTDRVGRHCEKVREGSEDRRRLQIQVEKILKSEL